MQALRLSRDDDSTPPTLTLTTVPKPTPTPGYALVKVHASAINPSDTLNALGGFSHTTYPRVPGRDFAGTVEAGSPAWLGRAVYGTSGADFGFSRDGCHAEYCLVPEGALVAKPVRLSFAQAASLGVPYTTAELVLRRAGVQAGEAVMVLGATGAVGAAAVQLARRAGCATIGVARSDSADVNSLADASLQGAIKLTGGKGPDVVIDTVGNAELTLAALKVLAVRGRYSFIAAPPGKRPEVTIDMRSVYRKEQTLVGSNSLSSAYSQEYMAELLTNLNAAFEAGELQPVDDSRGLNIDLAGAIAAYKARARGVITFQ